MDEILDIQGKLRPFPVRYANESKESHAEAAAVVDDWVGRYGREVRSLRQLSLKAGDPGKTMTRLCWAAWHAWGRRSFMVAPVLVEAFRNTSLGKVPTSGLALPAPALWIEGDMGTAFFPYPGKGLYVVKEEEDPSKPLYVVPGTGEQLFPPARDVLLYNYVFGDGANFAHAVGSLWLGRENLEDAITESIEFAARVAKVRGIEVRSDPGLPDASRETQERGLRALGGFLANALLYLTSPESDVQRVVSQGLEKDPKSAKAREIQDRIRRREGEVSSVGYRLTRVVHEKNGARRILDPEALRKSPAGHLVTGHWKHQPYGPESSLRKYMYILPYWRGEGGEEERIERADVVTVGGTL